MSLIKLFTEYRRATHFSDLYLSDFFILSPVCVGILHLSDVEVCGCKEKKMIKCSHDMITFAVSPLL